MTSVVLDASALLAFLRQEPGHDVVRPVLGGAVLSSVNLSETITKLIDYGASLEEVLFQVGRLHLDIRPFGEGEARLCSSLREKTRKLGLSLGDRACLALGLQLGLPVYTAEPIWEEANLGAEIVLIRARRRGTS